MDFQTPIYSETKTLENGKTETQNNYSLYLSGAGKNPEKIRQNLEISKNKFYNIILKNNGQIKMAQVGPDNNYHMEFSLVFKTKKQINKTINQLNSYLK
jgi:hypothetical protein